MSMGRLFLVVGGGGFLGRAIVEQLLQRSDISLRVMDLYQTWEDSRVEFCRGDLTNPADVKKACAGVHTVIHTASPPHGRPRALYFRVNVDGTRNLLGAAHEAGVRFFVFTSSASVVFDGSDIRNGNESLPYCRRHLDAYTESKAEAERAVLAADDARGMRTCALRPSGIFGPRDAQAWPGFLEAGKTGKSKLILGDGRNLMDWTYVDNVALAHLLAADKFLETPDVIGGQAYFITNGEPTPFWDMAKFVWANFDFPPPKFRLPKRLILWLTLLVDLIVWLLSPLVELHPTLTYFRVVNATAHRYFDISKAQRDLGYRPVVSLEEGKQRTLEYFKQILQEDITVK